jgi:hypothetical protein
MSERQVRKKIFKLMKPLIPQSLFSFFSTSKQADEETKLDAEYRQLFET